MPIEEGKPAPAFTLPGSDGKTHQLADYAGKTVILFFYPKDNTPGCTKEACGFRDRTHDWGTRDIVILGVSADSLASHEKFISKHELPYVLLTDETHDMMKQYGAYGEKKLYGKTYDGIIRSTVVIGPEGTVLKHWPKVTRAAQHPDQVADWLATQGTA